MEKRLKIKILLALLGASCVYVPSTYAATLNVTNDSNDITSAIELSTSNGNAGENSIIAESGINTITVSSDSNAYAVYTWTSSTDSANPVNLTIEGKTGNIITTTEAASGNTYTGSAIVSGYYNSTDDFGYGGAITVIADTGDNVIKGIGLQGYGVAAKNSIDEDSGVTIEAKTGNNAITGSADAAAAGNGIVTIVSDSGSNYLEGAKSEYLSYDGEGHALHVSNPSNTFNSTDHGVGYSLVEVYAGTSNTFIGNYDMTIVANGENATANITAGTTNTVTVNAARTADTDADTAETAAVFAAAGGTVNLVGPEGNTLSGGDMGIWALTQNTDAVDTAVSVTLTSESGTNTVSGSSYGIFADRSRDQELDSSHVQMITGIEETGTQPFYLPLQNPDYYSNGLQPAPSVTLTGVSNKVTGGTAGVRADDDATVTITATQNGNIISGDDMGIWAEDGGSVSVTGGGNNEISGNSIGLYAKSQMTHSYYSTPWGNGASSLRSVSRDTIMDDSSITVTSSSGKNSIIGTDFGIYATRSDNETVRYGISDTYFSQIDYDAIGSTVLVDGVDNEISGNIGIQAEKESTVTLTATGENKVSGDEAAIVSVTGSTATLTGGSVNVEGDLLAAHTYTYEWSNLLTGQSYSLQMPSSIAIEYGAGSSINGDMRAFDASAITVAPAEGETGSISIAGNAYAYGSDEDLPASVDTSNSSTDVSIYKRRNIDTWDTSFVGNDLAAIGTINLTLSNGSTWSGTADTGLMAYQDGDLTEDEIGTVNLELNDISIWTMTGSSAITSLSGSGGTVYYHDGGDALQVDTVTGSHTWALDLNYADHSQSDMIYVVNGTSDTQTLVVKNLSELDSQMSDGDAVRFATVKNSGGGFTEGTTYYVANGIYNDTLTIDNRIIADDPDADENYDGGNKPSQETVASLYGGDDATNIYLVKTVDAEENAGAVTPDKTRDIVWRYVTDLDTFTDRTGQSVYFTPGADQGGWVRLRYRNLGVDGVGEVDGNTYELGYTAVTRQNDERKDRFSASVSYGKEKGSWEGYGGDLEIRDFTVSLFDTHEYYPSAEEMAKKPAWKQGTHSYWDNYFKYHHVKTEYGAVDHHSGLKYDGDYSQDVYSLSTEYGRVNKLNEKWSIVPQAQLQLSYLGGYDYVDSQDIHVDGDHDWSLIGRLGFDLVDYLDKKQDNKIYFKASLLHEFFDGNDVTVSALGDSLRHEGDLSGTWGVIGLGYSSKIGEKQYFYLDAERYIGNDFDRTYNIRAGVNWKF